VDALMMALKTTFDAGAAADLRGVYELDLEEERFRLELTDGRLELARGSAEQPDATVETNAATLRKLVFGGRDLESAVSMGEVKVSGDRQALGRLLQVFPRPVAADGTVQMVVPQD
jgi:alkyl sulfatase BDS1-like metallo-beta-lactamase superfamily hydrolase